MAHYLVTGGAGFIGSNLVDALVADGHSVRVLDNLTTGRRANLAHLQGRIDFVEGDIRAYDQVLAAMQGIDYVLHQAALPSVPRSVQDPITSNAVNVDGTLHVLAAAQTAGVRRVVMASSSSVYGSNPALPKQETMCPQPKSPYAVSKLAGEQYGQVFWQVYGLETVALRYFNIFGPRQDPRSAYAAVIPRFIRAMLAGEPVMIHGDGQQSRDFTYIDNAVQANLLACTAPEAAGSVLNIACGSRYTLLELVEQLAAILGRSPQVVHTPSRAGDVPHSQADIERARTLLGYAPQVDFVEGLRRTAAWYLVEEPGQHG
ncbi:MAG: LPS biosynthesis protein WbpP [Chloroflexi bacterium]|nr:MAG: LPS biosynthesis protein WbpP [Chloroflexota bacterium]